MLSAKIQTRCGGTKYQRKGNEQRLNVNITKGAEMELNREQIIKALECCITGHHENCCNLGKWHEEWNCMTDIMKQSLALINELTAENKLLNVELGNANSEILRLIAEKKELTEENERLRAERDTLDIYNKDYKFKNKELTAFNRRWAKECAELQDECDQIKADTVQKMQDAVAVHFGTYTDKDTVKVLDVVRLLGKIAKEMLEGGTDGKTD